MRLLHVIHTVNPASGGTAEAVRNLILHPAGSSQAVLSLDHSTDPWTKNFASEVYCAGPGKGKYGYTRQLRPWFQLHLQEFDAAVVHGCWQYHGVATARAARRLNRPFFIFPHGMLDPYFKRASRWKHLKKVLYWRMERAVLQRAHAVLFTCAEERDRAHRSFPFASRDRVVQLGLSAPPRNRSQAREEFLHRFPELAGRRVLLYLGRLHPKKGVDRLLRAFTRVDAPQVHLLIVGPPASEAYRQELDRLATPLSGRVTFTGMLTGTLKTGALASAEALVLPSHQENFGFSAIEALSFGRPVLLSDQVNLWREIVEDGAGLVAPDTEDGTLRLLRRWLALTPDEITTMRAAAERCFNSRFQAETAASRFLSVIQETLSQSDDRSRSNLQLVHP